MSFFSELNKQKKNLKPVTTVITSLLGCKFTEEKDESGKIKIKNVLESCPGFVVDNKLDLQVAQILEYLYLGSQDPAQDSHLLEKYGMTHVLSVGIDLPKSNHSPNIKFFKVELLDEPEATLTEAFNSCFEFIDLARMENKDNKIFVHCNAGYSRAPTIVIGYLMKTFGYSLKEALEKVQEKRNVRPNAGFMKQLIQYEDKLKLLKPC